jgi:Glycosyl hydrolases family 39
MTTPRCPGASGINYDFWNSPQSDAPDVTGYKGFYYHFLDMKTGRRAPGSELSTIDTAFLLAGFLTASKPIYRVFELLHRLGNDLVPVHGKHKTVSAWVARSEGNLTVLLTNHAMPQHAIKAEQVRVRVAESGEPSAVSVQRIDEAHANPRRVWREMGEPDYLNAM